jgi:hypothetical protein
MLIGPKFTLILNKMANTLGEYYPDLLALKFVLVFFGRPLFPAQPIY